MALCQSVAAPSGRQQTDLKRSQCLWGVLYLPLQAYISVDLARQSSPCPHGGGAADARWRVQHEVPLPPHAATRHDWLLRLCPLPIAMARDYVQLETCLAASGGAYVRSESSWRGTASDAAVAGAAQADSSLSKALHSSGKGT